MIDDPLVGFNFPSLMVLGAMTVAGYYAGRLVNRLRMPAIIGYMLVGLLIGPSLINLLKDADLEGLAFINEIALGFVAVTIGSELSLKVIKRQGKELLTIIFAECLGTFAMVLVGIALLTTITSGRADWPLSLLLAAIASASAPAGTVAVIQEYKARGSLTSTLYAVVGFDDGLAILIFGFAYGIAKVLLPGSEGGTSDLIFAPAKEIMVSFFVGSGLGFVFSYMLRKISNARDYLILTFGFVLFGCGISSWLHISLILTNMMIGFVLVNTRHESLVQKVSEQLGNIMPLLFIFFFAVAGAHLDIYAAGSLGLLGLVYILGRMAGKAGGAWLGAVMGGAEDKIRKYLGWGLHTQAGVAIGLALIAKGDLDEISRRVLEHGNVAASSHVEWIGNTILTTVTATCLFFEVVGPILAYMALKKAGEIPENEAEA
ncbi:MAG: cation:proton antiporter [Planctomycetes bacterium]|nr:cation:proton antiporter [Planctomycetota bacterium]